jgi:hypothetical protein
MLGKFHYHGLIRKYIAVFGTLFNDIKIIRIDSSNNVTDTINVPLAYGPKQKFITRLSANPNLQNHIALSLPRLGFDMTSLMYDPERSVNKLNKNHAFKNGNRGTMYAPVPYILSFSLYALVKNAIDGAMIIEQILPAFKPEFTVTIHAVPSMNIKIDMPIILNDVSVEDSYEGDFISRRAIIYTLNFTAKVMFYPNIKGTGFGDFSDDEAETLIRTTITNFHVLNSSQIAEALNIVVLENSTDFSTTALLSETGEKLILEESSSSLDVNRVVSSISNKMPLNVSPDDTISEATIVDIKQFFAEGRDYDPVTGQYNN